MIFQACYEKTGGDLQKKNEKSPAKCGILSHKEIF